VDDLSVRALALRMKAIREPRMRRVIAAEFLRTTAPESAVVTLAALFGDNAHGSDIGYSTAADAITAALSADDLLDYDARARLYQAAVHAELEQVARLFLDARRPEGRIDAAAREPERPIVPRGRTLTLGERKSLARTHERAVLGHVIRDPHPDVVSIVLDNPHTTEHDVLAIVVRRPAPAASLQAVARHPRWRVRYAIKHALVLNPYTPVPVALRLVSSLRTHHLAAIAGDGNLDPLVRQQAADVSKRVL
jgi:hypothetical protein